MVNRHAVRRILDRLFDVTLPVLLGLLDHARNQIDIDLIEAFRLGPLVGPAHFFRAMRPTIDLENVVVKVFNTQTQARHPDIFNRRELARIQGSRFTLKGHFLGIVPWKNGFHSVSQLSQLLRREIRGRPSTKINELGLSSLDERLASHHLKFGHRRVQVVLDLIRTLIGINAKVAEMTASPAEGNVVIETQWHSLFRGLIVSGLNLGILIIRPKRKGRVIRNEIISRPGGFLFICD